MYANIISILYISKKLSENFEKGIDIIPRGVYNIVTIKKGSNKMKYINIGTHEQYVEEIVNWLKENNIRVAEPFEIDDLWKVPCMPIGKEQKQMVENYIEYRVINDLF